MDYSSLLSSLPFGLRNPLIDEYNSIVKNYMEHRWTPAELSGGKFCEIVYTIIDGYSQASYPASPNKPRNFVDACKRLENNSHVPRSFQILIPRMLPALYEIRNNRNVGHVGGDVNPNHMDSLAVLEISSWIMGELVRVFHNLTIAQAQKAVDYITDRKIPLIWESENIRRVLNPKIPIPDQILLLIGTSMNKVKTSDLYNWLDYENKGYFKTLLRKFHKNRLVELSIDESEIEILPPGTEKVEELISKFNH